MQHSIERVLLMAFLLIPTCLFPSGLLTMHDVSALLAYENHGRVNGLFDRTVIYDCNAGI